MAVSSYGSKGPPSDAGSDDKKQTKKRVMFKRIDKICHLP